MMILCSIKDQILNQFCGNNIFVEETTSTDSIAQDENENDNPDNDGGKKRTNGRSVAGSRIRAKEVKLIKREMVEHRHIFFSFTTT